jgi:predicted ester cyclase
VLLHIDQGRIEIGYTFSEADSATRLSRELTYRPEDFAGGTTDPAGLEARMSAQSEEALRRLKWLVEHQLVLQTNKRIVRDVLERAFNQQDFAALEEGFTAEAAIHDPGMDFRGPAELRGGLESLLSAFPDFHFSVLDALAEDDRVVLRYRGRGTQRAEFLGIPATGQRIDYTGIILVRLEGQQIAEFWAQPDQLGLLKQLGARISTNG